MPEKGETKAGNTGKHITRSVERTRSVFARFPLIFTLLGVFGLVAVLYGFEGIIDQIDLFADNPFILLITGILVLAFTGRLYKVLGE